MKILIVEDDVKIVEFLKQGLEEENYSVDYVYDGNEALYLILNNTYDLILLDLMIPYINGIDLCKDIRKNKINTPVIMLTAKSSIENTILGLNSGANDYISKPFSFDELIARIKVQLRTNISLNNILSIENLTFDIDNKLVKRDNNIINLSSKEYMLLELLLRNKNKFISEEDINNSLWNMDEQTASNIIRVYIYRLRKKIDKNFDLKLIHTTRGLGYKISSTHD